MQNQNCCHIIEALLDAASLAAECVNENSPAISVHCVPSLRHVQVKLLLLFVFGRFVFREMCLLIYLINSNSKYH